MTDKRAYEKSVVHEVERAELTQIDGGGDSSEPPGCGFDPFQSRGFRHEVLMREIRNSPPPHTAPPPWPWGPGE